MSHIVYSQKSLSLASGLNWPVLKLGKGRFGARAAVRGPARTVRATKYVSIDNARGDAKHIGLYTPDVLLQSVKGEIHSLGIVFLEALAKVTSQGRESINAILSMEVDGSDHSKRAVVVISDGNIVHDSVENVSRVRDIVKTWREQLGDVLQIYGSGGDLPDAREVHWADLAANASKRTLMLDVPRNLIFPALLGTVMLAIAAYTAYHYMVVVPGQKAERMRMAAALDRTGDYLSSLQEAVRSVGWEKESFLADLNSLRENPYWTNGWVLDTAECAADPSNCTEKWVRLGGNLPTLVKERQSLTYEAQEKAKDDEASFARTFQRVGEALSVEALPADATDADMRLRPVVNELVNAGVVVQISEPVAWPPVPLQGVRPDAVIKRRKVTLTADYHLIEQAVRLLPGHVVADGYRMSMNKSPFSASVTAYAYVK